MSRKGGPAGVPLCTLCFKEGGGLQGGHRGPLRTYVWQVCEHACLMHLKV